MHIDDSQGVSCCIRFDYLRYSGKDHFLAEISHKNLKYIDERHIRCKLHYCYRGATIDASNDCSFSESSDAGKSKL